MLRKETRQHEKKTSAKEKEMERERKSSSSGFLLAATRSGSDSPPLSRIAARIEWLAAGEDPASANQ